jgi:hypothetical protein
MHTDGNPAAGRVETLPTTGRQPCIDPDPCDEGR